MSDLCKAFAKNLKDKRRSLGFTQKDLADMMNYSTKAISKWEAGHALPPTSTMPTLAKLLKTTIDELLSPPPVIKYYLGIAGYDEKCDLVLCDLSKNVLKSLTIDIVNPTMIGLEKMIKRLTDAIFFIAGDYSFGEISVSVGIDGIFRLGKNELKNLLQGFGFALVRVLSNSHNSMAAALGNDEGIFVNLGYGSIVFAKRTETNTTRIGGYGYYFDEPFSAFALGRDAVGAVFRANDGLARSTRIEKFIRNEMNIFDGVLSPVVFSDRLLVCRLAKVVFEAYREGDGVAEEILKSNIEKLWAMIRVASKRLEKGNTKLVLYGSLCEHHDIIIPMMKEAMKQSGDRFDISVCNTPAVMGAVILAGTEGKNI